MTQATGHFVIAERSRGAAMLRDYVALTKPRITLMVAMTAYLGYALALRETRLAPPGWLHLIATLLGTALSCMGAAVLNQVYEKRTDALMQRTRRRPIPAGRVSAGHGAVLGLVVSVLGVALLWAGANAVAAAASLLTIASYLLLYTPMKRWTSLSTIVGAAPGALPPIIGAAAATGSVTPGAACMFAIMFLWQLPHFLAIAWLYREDYARAGFPMLPVLDPDGSSTFRQIALGCMTLLPLGLLPTMIGVTGAVYFVGALLAGLAFLALGLWLVIGRTAWHARLLFFASLVYLPVVLALMNLDAR